MNKDNAHAPSDRMNAKIREALTAAVHAHTNLNTWVAVIALLEGGMLYGNTSQHSAASKVIAIAKREQQKFLVKCDKALAAVETLK